VIKDVARIPATADAAAWLTERIVTFGESVLSVVPSGFEAYARIFHPASPGGSTASLQPGEVQLSWTEVADSAGTAAHRAMQWPSLIGTYMSYGDPRAKTHPGVEPTTGSLTLSVARVAMKVLRGHTRTPERCWFAVWEGGGGLADFVTTAPSFGLPHRTYLMVTGPIETVLQSMMDPPSRVLELGLAWPHYQSANLWWPDDRAWCVATEIDFQSTYVGASRRCIDQLLADDHLETYEVAESDGVTWADDGLNPKPNERYP
jgi:hypothetical protein